LPEAASLPATYAPLVGPTARSREAGVLEQVFATASAPNGARLQHGAADGRIQPVSATSSAEESSMIP
jgi:hypothetical protein